MNKLVPGLAAAAFARAPSSQRLPPPPPRRAAPCPRGNSGYVLWDVSTEPYGADNAVDEQGNGDGWACASPRKVVVDEDGNPFQTYNFIDNRVVAH